MELLSKDKVFKEFPLKIQFTNEQAIDCGGVCHMFSAFAYFHFF